MALIPSPNPDHIAKLACGPKVVDRALLDWEAILTDVISGNAFGVDRIDSFLRILHPGCGTGHFDHYRLLDMLRILPQARSSLKRLHWASRSGG